MMRPLYLLLVFFVWDDILSQMSIHSDLYLGPEYELYNEFNLTTFYSGVVTVDRNGGVFSFALNGTWENSDNLKHIDGLVRKYNPSAFTFPVGHLGSYQPLHISLADNNSFVDAPPFKGGRWGVKVPDTPPQKEYESVLHKCLRVFGCHS